MGGVEQPRQRLRGLTPQATVVANADGEVDAVEVFSERDRPFSAGTGDLFEGRGVHEFVRRKIRDEACFERLNMRREIDELFVDSRRLA